jgi:alpha-L-rhamnosidase
MNSEVKYIDTQRPYNLDPKEGLEKIPLIWFGATGPAPQNRFFRGQIETFCEFETVELILLAESKFHLWVNGQYIARGPSFHHPHRPAVSRFCLDGIWKRGSNVIAIHALFDDIVRNNAVPTSKPGVAGKLTITDAAGNVHEKTTDSHWLVTDQTGWLGDTPSHGSGLGHLEFFDSKIAPQQWYCVNFDDSDWQAAEASRYESILPLQYIDPQLPNLRTKYQSFEELKGTYRIETYPTPEKQDSIEQWKKWFIEEKWLPASELATVSLEDANKSILVKGLNPNQPTAIVVDMGKQFVGRIEVSFDSSSAGVLDMGWSERLGKDGRPQVFLKDIIYLDRILACPGQQQWTQSQFSSGRYLLLVFRGFSGSLKINRLGMQCSEPDINWQGRFNTDDSELDAISNMCHRTIRIGTQEGMMDCPTREQATYIGDGLLTGRWITMLTGDASYWRHLIRESFAEQRADGLIRTTAFSGHLHSLVDYLLLAVNGVLDYYQHTRDIDTVNTVIQGCRNLIGWFQRYSNSDGLFALTWEEMTGEWKKRDGDFWVEKIEDIQNSASPWGLNLFIDHAGMGWHNIGKPGIDRRGLNAALNAMLTHALRAQSQLEKIAGCPDQARKFNTQADQISQKVKQSFYDSSRALWVDGLIDGQPSPQISQQTNTWCILAGLNDKQESRKIMTQILDEQWSELARSGPYFWSYMLEVLASLNMHDVAMKKIRKLWGTMVQNGATTLWETFCGDENDSWCHPWSAAPLEFMLKHILGLDIAREYSGVFTLKPRFDLLNQARGKMCTPAGPVKIAWTRAANGKIKLNGKLPASTTAVLIHPSGYRITTVSGDWTCDVDGQIRLGNDSQSSIKPTDSNFISVPASREFDDSITAKAKPVEANGAILSP